MFLLSSKLSKVHWIIEKNNYHQKPDHKHHGGRFQSVSSLSFFVFIYWGIPQIPHYIVFSYLFTKSDEKELVAWSSIRFWNFTYREKSKKRAKWRVMVIGFYPYRLTSHSIDARKTQFWFQVWTYKPGFPKYL